MATLEERVTALEATASGILETISDLTEAIGKTPSVDQVDAAIAILREDIDENAANIVTIQKSLTRITGIVDNHSIQIKKLQPSGTL